MPLLLLSSRSPSPPCSISLALSLSRALPPSARDRSARRATAEQTPHRRRCSPCAASRPHALTPALTPAVTLIPAACCVLRAACCVLRARALRVRPLGATLTSAASNSAPCVATFVAACSMSCERREDKGGEERFCAKGVALHRRAAGRLGVLKVLVRLGRGGVHG
eukprot:6205274-Pleurochrysis_carterae.AAC.1